MNKKIREIAEESGFCFWGDESWGPGPDHIDWSAIYDKEFEEYTRRLILECADIVYAQDVDPAFKTRMALAITSKFGIY